MQVERARQPSSNHGRDATSAASGTSLTADPVRAPIEMPDQVLTRDSHLHGAYLKSAILSSLTYSACAFSKMSTNSRYRREISLTATSRVVVFARHPTRGSQKSVRPTA